MHWSRIQTLNTRSSTPPSCARASSGRKRGSEDEAIGRSRGGLSTKISAAVDALGNPVRFILTAGQVNDRAGRDSDQRSVVRQAVG
jgi:hypothetical protein